MDISRPCSSHSSRLLGLLLRLPPTHRIASSHHISPITSPNLAAAGSGSEYEADESEEEDTDEEDYTSSEAGSDDSTPSLLSDSDAESASSLPDLIPLESEESEVGSPRSCQDGILGINYLLFLSLSLPRG